MGDTRTPLLEKNLVVSELDELNRLFNKWRFFRMVSAICGGSAIIPAATDYELHFSEQRTAENCLTDDSATYAVRNIIMALSLLGIGFLIPYRYYFLKWKRHIPRTFRELPSLNKLTIMQVFEMRKKASIGEWLGDDMIPAIVLYCIFPYPWLSATYTVPQQISYQEVEVCYFFAELFYAIMYFRIVFLILSLFNYGKFQNQAAMRYCAKFNVKPSPTFSMKCYINQRPLTMLALFFIVPGVVIFGLIMRIFERPMMLPNMDFDYAGNAMWGIIITMTTVGYGDTVPTTISGRVVVVLSAFWGGIILSLTSVAMGSFLLLKSNEKKALDGILLSKVASKAISTAMKYYNSKEVGLLKRHDQWKDIKSALRDFSDYKEENAMTNTIDYKVSALSHRINTVEAQVEDITNILQNVHDKLDNFMTKGQDKSDNN